MNCSIDDIDHVRSRLNSQRVVREARSRRDVGGHFPRELQLPIGAFREQHDHQVLERDNANLQLHEFGVRQRRHLG